MANGSSSDRKVPVMPQDPGERAIDAWNRSVRAESKVDSITDHALEQYGLIMRELGSLNSHTQQLTNVVREMRDRIDFGSERPITFPDLEKVIAAERQRDSDRAQAQRMRKISGWISKGVGKAVSTIVAAAVLLLLGWLAREVLGPVATRPTPALTR